ncbi:RNA-guided endonuclease InsQ/TnpB family protein [Vibrio olivae]|uniref:RNA-guided endonuclease InsQ/TnpB family protein n=1 Tax=Vibrio olivae TaxID=1243002 RepID=A0ABV5HUA6_9VIBR
MRLVDRHIIKDNRFEDICLKSGLLYNYVLYLVRQGIFNKEYLKEYDLSTKLGRENQFDFRQLPASVSQQVVGQVFKSVNSWIKLKSDFDRNPDKYNNHRPHLPKYKEGKKQNMVVFTTFSCRVKDDGYIHFVKNVIEPIKTNVKKDELKQVRIVPQATCYVVEVIYERKETDLNLDKDNFLSIDLGLNNLCSCISNVGIKPFIINGKVIKSLNRWYNKKKARLMSYVGDNGTSRRIRRISLYRNCWIDDKMHKISKYIVNFCVSNNIGRIIIGLNKEWKQEINIGRRNNQHFVSIPHSKLIDKIMYKAKLLGIEVVTHEESYTSKIDHLAFEEMKYQDNYLGKRKRRGLFQSSIGKLINADINGAIGIARKVVGDSCINTIVSSGFAFNPIRLNIL